MLGCPVKCKFLGGLPLFFWVVVGCWELVVLVVPGSFFLPVSIFFSSIIFQAFSLDLKSIRPLSSDFPSSSVPCMGGWLVVVVVLGCGLLGSVSILGVGRLVVWVVGEGLGGLLGLLVVLL